MRLADVEKIGGDTADVGLLFIATINRVPYREITLLSTKCFINGRQSCCFLVAGPRCIAKSESHLSFLVLEAFSLVSLCFSDLQPPSLAPAQSQLNYQPVS